MMNEFRCKRIYEPAADTDGFRVLVDRLWPRGIRKENARIDLWAKEIAPSKELRKWFSHDPAKYDAFEALYRQELNRNPASHEFKNLCTQKAQDQQVTLLYGAKDEKYNHAVVLKEWLEERTDP